MKTLVLGASLKEERYSNSAIKLLRSNKHEVVAHGLRAGKVDDVDIITDLDDVTNIDTVSLYLGPKNQEPYYQFLIDLKPRRVIFNPRTENSELQKKLTTENISWEEACTLVLLRTSQF